MSPEKRLVGLKEPDPFDLVIIPSKPVPLNVSVVVDGEESPVLTRLEQFNEWKEEQKYRTATERLYDPFGLARSSEPLTQAEFDAMSPAEQSYVLKYEPSRASLLMMVIPDITAPRVAPVPKTTPTSSPISGGGGLLSVLLVADATVRIFDSLVEPETRPELQTVTQTGTTTTTPKKQDDDDDGGGACDTSDQVDSANRICGGRAATVQPKGKEPGGAAFYASDLNPLVKSAIKAVDQAEKISSGDFVKDTVTGELSSRFREARDRLTTSN